MKIILINGQSGSGKTSVARIIDRELNCRNVLIKNNSEQVKEICKESFGWEPYKEDKSERVRKLFIDVTQAGYNFDKYFWDKITYKKIEFIERFTDYLIIPDWRYECSYDFWCNKLGYEVFTVRVERPNYNNGYNEEVKKDDIGYLNDIDFDLYIYNLGSLEELEEKVREGVKVMGW